MPNSRGVNTLSGMGPFGTRPNVFDYEHKCEVPVHDSVHGSTILGLNTAFVCPGANILLHLSLYPYVREELICVSFEITPYSLFAFAQSDTSLISFEAMIV